MSRLPPFPRGQPADRYPAYNNRNDGYNRDYRDDRNGRDDHRPRVDDYNRPRSPPPRQMYQFGGNSRHDERSDYDDRRYPRRYDDRGPAPNYNSYPPPSRNEPASFTFRQEPPPNVDFRNADNYRRSPPRQRRRQDDRPARNNNQRGRGNFRGRGGVRLAADREFLRGNRAPTPELLEGMNGEESATRYKDVDEMSDSDEADMEGSDDDNLHERPRKKQLREEGDRPQWSNPDPYTALPPVDDTLRQKKDMVKMIRKARVTNDGNAKSDTAASDFISFNFDDEEGQIEEEEDYEPPPAAPLQPINNGVPGSLSSRITLAPKVATSTKRNVLPNGLEKVPTTSSIGVNAQTLAAEEENKGVHPNGTTSTRGPTIDLTAESPPISRKPAAPKPTHVAMNNGDSLGSRKRTIDDQLKPAPRIHDSHKGKKAPVGGGIVRQWKASVVSHPTPWIEIDHSDTHNMGFWLHKEIMDFYHFVKPLKFEQTIREKLVEDLHGRLSYQFHGAEIQSFGSFPAGLYLPTADMDVVMLSREFRQSGRVTYNKSHLFKLRNFLYSSELAIRDSVECITSAKVPLVKYVDKLTGLRVDMSFENDTGLVANETFQQYKKLYPAMPILVTVIKHLLTMRGLNEPVNGGIGGFSVICLVVSLLQHMPQVQSKNMIPEHHLGEMLMEFLKYYGNEFNPHTTGIQINPPAYFEKRRSNIVYKGDTFKFSILDPNNSNNDIAGGSSNTRTIVQCFSDCAKKLQQRMAELQHSPDRRKQSLLECILGGNYSSFKLQREHLAHVHEHRLGDVDMEYA